jgi:hypothetical protein
MTALEVRHAAEVFVAQEEALPLVVSSLSNEVLSADRSAKTSGGALSATPRRGALGSADWPRGYGADVEAGWRRFWYAAFRESQPFR